MGGIEVAIAFGGALIGSLFTTGVSYAVRALTQKPFKKPPPTSYGIENLRNTSRTNVSPGRIVYGKTRFAGVLAYAESVMPDGTPKKEAKFLHVCILCCDGPVQSISNIELGDKEATSSEFGNNTLFITMLGSEDQEPLGSGSYSVGGFTGVKLPTKWTKTPGRNLSGVAYIWGIFKFDAEVFPNGPPNIRFTVEGRRLYDPRIDGSSPYDEDTWSYSSNPALCAYDYMTNKRYGMGIARDAISIDSVMAAASVCDETVTFTAAPYATSIADDSRFGTQYSETRYTCNGVFETDGKRGDILDRILACMAGTVLMRNGQLHIVAGCERAPSFTLTADDLAGDFEMTPGPSTTDRVNRVTGTFINPENNWVPQDFEPQVSQDFIEEDGGNEYTLEVDFPFTTSKFEAQRLAQILLRRGRRRGAIKWPGKLTCLGIEPGDVGYIDLPNVLPPNCLVFVEETSINEDGIIELAMVRYSSDEYEYEDIIDKQSRPRTNLPSPWAVAPPSDVTLAVFSTGQYGLRQNAVRVTITPPSSGQGAISHYRVTYRHADDEKYNETNSRSTVIELTGLKEGGYTVSVETVNLSGYKSTEVRRYINVQAIRTAPNNVTGFSVQTDASGEHRFSWSVPVMTQHPITQYHIKYLSPRTDTNALSDAELSSAMEQLWRRSRTLALTPAGNNLYVTRQLSTPGKTYLVGIKAVDSTGVESDDETVIQVVVPYPNAVSGLVSTVDLGELGWPGEIVNGHRTSDGWVECAGLDRWSALPSTWNAWTQWTRNSSVMTYKCSEEVDLGRDISVQPVANVTVSDGAEYKIRMQASLDNSTLGETGGRIYSPMRELVPVTARRFKFDIAVRPRGNVKSPYLKHANIRLSRYAHTISVDDFQVGQNVQQVIQRREFRRWKMQKGNLLNAKLVDNTDGGCYMECDDESSASFDYNAGTNRISIPSANQLKITNQWTIECTIYVRALHNGTSYIVSKNGSTDYCIAITGTTFGTLSFLATPSSGDSVPTNEIVLPDAVGMHHIAYSYDGRILRAYIDGIETYSSGNARFILDTSNTALAIGNNSSGSGNPFDGAVEEVRIWNVARTREQISAGIDADFSGTEAGLVGYWKCNDSTGSTVSDLSSYGNDGTLYGSWVRLASRMSPPFSLSAVRHLKSLRVFWDEDTPSDTTVRVFVSSDALSWTEILSRQQLAGSPFPELDADGAGSAVYVYAVLESTDVSATPSISSITIEAVNTGTILTNNSPDDVGDFTYPIQDDKFSSIDSAVITAIQGANEPLTWSVVHKSPEAIRFRLRTANGSALNYQVAVDMAISGGAPAQ